MKRKSLIVCLTLGALAVISTVLADDGGGEHLGPYKLLTTIAIPTGIAPTGLVGNDISWVDSQAGRYYLADRGDATATPAVPPRIDVIDTKHNKYLFAIPTVFAGNGVVAIHQSKDDEGEGEDNGAGELWVGDANSNVEVFDLQHPLVKPLLIPTGGTMRADELGFDPRDHIVLIANDRAVDLFVTFISTTTHKVLGHIRYDGSLGNPKSTGGLEQPVFNAKTGKFYLTVPATDANPKGEVDEINPVTMKITRIFPSACTGPAGLALIPGQRLATSCGDIISIETGKVLKTIAGTGGDEIWFNPGDERVYYGGGLDRISVPVVDTETTTLITTLTVGVVFTPPPTPPPPAHTTHSLAADSENNRIFVPVTHEGIKVYTDATGSDDN
jgi:hypothetical protein